MTRTKMEKIRLAIKIFAELSDEEWEEIGTMYNNLISNPKIKISVKLDGEKLSNITKTLHMLGISVGTRGYEYVREAVIYFLDAENICKIGITTELYPHIAKEYGDTESNVERAIRNALKMALQKGDKELVEKIFGKVDSVSNSVGIAAIAEYLQMNY